jgi:hypothetical protein
LTLLSVFACQKMSGVDPKKEKTRKGVRIFATLCPEAVQVDWVNLRPAYLFRVEALRGWNFAHWNGEVCSHAGSHPFRFERLVSKRAQQASQGGGFEAPRAWRARETTFRRPLSGFGKRFPFRQAVFLGKMAFRGKGNPPQRPAKRPLEQVPGPQSKGLFRIGFLKRLPAGE